VTQADPPEVTAAFFAMTRTRLSRRDPAFRLLGTNEEAGRAMEDLAYSTRSTMWNMQRFMTFYSLRDGRPLT
jgi:hypothetical protein